MNQFLCGPVALPSQYSRTGAPEFDNSSKKFFFVRAIITPKT